jgi:hypothetical protein
MRPAVASQLQTWWLRMTEFLIVLLEGYCSCLEGLNKHAIPFLGYPKNTLGSITYLLTHGRVLRSPTKINKETNTLIMVCYN